MRVRLTATRVLAVVLVLGSAAVLGGEQIREIRLDGALHGYFGGETPRRLYTFGSEREAETTVERIVAITGLRPNFDVQAGAVPNAAAAIRNGRRLLIYNPGFIEQLKQRTGGDWAGTSVMAHEVGHHLQGHTITNQGSHPTIELEADEFSGFVLNRLGASLADAQAAMQVLPASGGSGTHPPKEARLAAIASGWRRAAESPDPDTDPNRWPDPNTDPDRWPNPNTDPNRWPNPNTDPNRWPNPTPPVSNVCYTPYGACQLYLPPVPVGTPCYCTNVWGQSINGSIR